MNINWSKAILGGVVATVVMTAVGLWAAPMMGIPPMNPANMLAGAMGGSLVLGWIGHFMIGIILAVIYAVVGPMFGGAPWLRGAIYGIGPWFMVTLMVVPMMGMPIFFGSAKMAIGSLIGHIVYGIIVGTMYSPPQTEQHRSARA